MWNAAKGLWRWFWCQNDWHEATIGDRFVWQRWTPSGWEYREMTDEEQRAVFAMWSIK